MNKSNISHIKAMIKLNLISDTWI